ncbi:MAG: cyclic nucleotide-binding domain-containing protein [Planctomycetes bacterium]|nr:cyclic nucleotide-binding domain-containing protein [Planctomycetota bacterium]
MADSPDRSAVRRLFEAAFRIRPAEFGRVQAFLLFLTTISVFWTVGFTAGDTLFFSRFEPAEARRLFPFVFVGLALATVAVTWVVDFLQGRISRTRLIVATHLALALTVLLLRAAASLGNRWVCFAIAIWMDVCGLICVTLFFSYMGDFFTGRDARRLYGYVGGGMALGTVAGGYAVSPIVRAIGPDNLLFVCAGLMACGAAWGIVIRRLSKPVEEERIAGDDGGPRPSLAAVLAGGYVRLIMVMVLAGVMFGVLVQYQFKVVAGSAMREEALASYFGRFYALLGAAQLVVQFVLVGPLLRRFGPVWCLLVLPTSLVLANAGFLFHPVLAMAAAANFVRMGFAETLDLPARELLFLPLPTRLRLRAQAIVGGMLVPIGMGAGGLLLLGLSRVVPRIHHLTPVGIGLGIVWIVSVLFLRAQHRKALSGTLRRSSFDPADLSRLLDAEGGGRAIAELLRADDAGRAILAFDLWRGRPLGDLASLVREKTAAPDAALAVRALEALGESPDPANVPAIEAAIEDPRAEVRAAAVLALLANKGDEAVLRVAPWADAPDPLVRSAALVGCARHGGYDGALLVYPRLERLRRSEAAPDRAEAARVLAQFAGRRATRAFRELLEDPSPEVRRETLVACRAARDPGLVSAIADRMKEPRLQPLAVLALEALPPEAAPAIAERTRRTEAGTTERAALARILGTVGGPGAVRALWEFVHPETPLVVRVAAGRALRRLRARAADGPDLDEVVAGTCERVSLSVRAREECRREQPVTSRLFHDRARLEMEVLFSLLTMECDAREIARIETALFGGSESRRSNAIELLDALLPHKWSSAALSAVGAWASESGGAGMTDDTRNRLLAAEPWMRAIALHHSGGKEMKDADPNLYRVIATVSFLKQVDLFREVPADYLASVAGIAREQGFAAGEKLFAEGDRGDSCYLIMEGRVRILAGGKEVAALGPRECVGEMSLLDGEPRSATAVTAEEARLLRIGTEDFHDMLATHPGIAAGLLRTLARRLRGALAKQG